MNTNKIFKEARRLHRLGFAVHWLHPNSKRPVESGWTTGPRKTWDYLKETYSEPLNLGVRLGTPSKIEDRGYLAVVDVDVKSTEERHRKEAVAAAKRLIGNAKCPVVLSGRGNGSRHYYCLTAKPFKTYDPARSDERVKVHMPSKKPSKQELEELTEAEIQAGTRMAWAWEISLYSDGRQVVLPPSIHPDSNKPYVWATNLVDAGSLPVIEFASPKMVDINMNFTGVEGLRPDEIRKTIEPEFKFTLSPVQLDWLDVSARVKKGIVTGEGVDDRSAFLLPAATALISAGLSQDEVLSVLTEPDTFLGACAYEHAKTKNRARAAYWVWKYTFRKVAEERSAEAAFENTADIEPVRKLSPEEARIQTEETEAEIDWRDTLDKTANGKYRNTLHNCKTIITHVCGQKNVVGRDEFSVNDYYLCDTPWRSKEGDPVIDQDIIRIKFFCAERFGIEFNDNIINQSLLQIADLNRYHPVRDWLNGLRWDGVSRIDTWLKDYAGAVGPEPYLSDVSRKFLVAMVARVFEPGKKFDTILILEGNQGTGKSTLLARLAGGRWFTDAALSIGDKDSVLTIQSKWLVELGELSSMSKADLDLFKAFVAQQTDRIRAPYGKRVEEFPRQSVFAGTTNLDEYLRDMTGNRRFWTVKLTAERIDFDGVSVAREQLFAEALAMYRMGEPLYLDDPNSEAQAIGEQAKRLHIDEWLSTIEEIVNADLFPRDSFEIKDVAKRMDQQGAHRMSPLDQQRITKCLQLLGAEKFREPTGRRRRMWKMMDLEDVQRRPAPSSGSVDGNSPMETEF